MSSSHSQASPPPKAREPQGKKTAMRYPFWFGGSASSMAACVTHPLDLGMCLDFELRLIMTASLYRVHR